VLNKKVLTGDDAPGSPMASRIARAGGGIVSNAATAFCYIPPTACLPKD
jgi:hypothetical protein